MRSAGGWWRSCPSRGRSCSSRSSTGRRGKTAGFRFRPIPVSTETPRPSWSRPFTFPSLPQRSGCVQGGLSDLQGAGLPHPAFVSDVEVIPRIDKPVEPKIVDELLKKFVEGSGSGCCSADRFNATIQSLEHIRATEEENHAGTGTLLDR